MAKVSIATLEQAAAGDPPAGFAGGDTRAFFARERDPLHLRLHRLDAGAVLRIDADATESILYVWQGDARAGGRALDAGSSLIVEDGAAIAVAAGDAGATILSFAPASPSERTRAGTAVHLLPVETVPRLGDMGGASGVGGGMHADATLPTCALWLHENVFPAATDDAPPVRSENGIHAHSEDEVIFVTGGQIRLGAKLYGPGTAIAIAADTFYSFTPGPGGMSFVNFRAGQPSDIQFRNGNVVDEVAYWRDRTGSPRYTAPLAA